LKINGQVSTYLKVDNIYLAFDNVVFSKVKVNNVK